MLAEFPGCRLWFSDGTNEVGKVVANPNIGYGAYTITYADGSSREFYRIGLSANTTGISVYVLGLDDKTYLARTYGASIGKATVTGYCIRFRRLSVIDADVLLAAIRDGMALDQSRLSRDRIAVGLAALLTMTSVIGVKGLRCRPGR